MFTDGWWDRAAKRLKPGHSTAIAPRGVVFHSTHTHGIEPALKILENASGHSTHFLVGRGRGLTDREVVQMVPVDRKARHAGPSRYEIFRDLDDVAIGIHVVNSGWAKMDRQGRLVDGNGVAVPDSQSPHQWIEADEPRVGAGRVFWRPFGTHQLEAIEELVADLVDSFPSIAFDAGASDVDTRHHAVDPGPAFPLRRFRALLTNADVNTLGEGVVNDGNEITVRAGPGAEFEKIATLTAAQAFYVTGTVKDWLKIKYVFLNCGVEYEGFVLPHFVTVR